MYKRYFYPNIRQSILLLLILTGLQFFIGALIVAVSVINDTSQYPAEAVLSLSILATMLTAALGVFKSKTPLKAFFSVKIKNKICFVYALIFYIGTYFLVSFVIGIIENFMPTNEELNEIFAAGFNSWIGVISIVVLGPIFEELLFRGVILRGFLKNYSTIKAVIVSSLLFGILHFNIVQSVTASIIGLALGYIFIKTGSLAATILLHMINNGLSTVFYHITSKYRTSDPLLMFLSAAFIIAGAVSLYFLHRMENNISPILEEKDKALKRYAEAEASAVVENDNPQNSLQLTPPFPLHHSGFGIASFILSLTVGLCFTIIFIILAAVSVTHIYLDKRMISAFILIIMLCTIVSIAGLGLGTAGALQKNKKKIFAILGIVFNSLSILLTLAIIIFYKIIVKGI